MKDDAWQEAMVRHKLRDLDRERKNEDGQSGQGHKARSSTRRDCLGVTDTPVCERFHGHHLTMGHRRRGGRVVGNGLC